MSEVVLGLGSNLGDRLANLVAAVNLLAERGIQPVRQSTVFETEAVGPEQPKYLNAAIAATTGLEPGDVLTAAKEVERLLGRVPGPRWGPRPADVDILFYDDRSIESPDLSLPHPRIAGRAFVLAPLAEVVEGPLPVLGETAAALLARLDGAPPVRFATLSLR